MRIITAGPEPTGAPSAGRQERGPGGEVGHDGQPEQGRPDACPKGDVEGLAPARQLGQDLQPADDHLDRQQDGRQHGQPDDRRVVALGPPGGHSDRHDDHPDDGRDVAVKDLGGGRVGDRREERAAHQRPVREDERRVGRGRDVRAEQEQGVRGGRPEGRQQGEPLAAAPARDVARKEAPDENEHEDAQEGHGAGQVGRDRLAAVAQADGLLTQPGLEADQDDGHHAPPEQRRPVAMVAPGQDGQTQDQQAEDGRDIAVEPLQPGLVIAQGRDQLALAQGPVGAAQARVGGPHDDPDRDQHEGDGDGDRCELLKPGHQASASCAFRDRPSNAARRRRPRRLGRTGRCHSSHPPPESPPAGTIEPMRPLVLLATAILVAACAGNAASAAPSSLVVVARADRRSCR